MEVLAGALGFNRCKSTLKLRVSPPSHVGATQKSELERSKINIQRSCLVQVVFHFHPIGSLDGPGPNLACGLRST